MTNLIVYIHGKGGSAEEAEHFDIGLVAEVGEKVVGALRVRIMKEPIK